MKRFLALLLTVAVLLALPACDRKRAESGNPADKIADEITSPDGKYEIAFVMDVGHLKDKSFNQGTFDGVKLYASAHKKTYKYYMPANGDLATDNDRSDAMKAACGNGAKIVIAAGYLQESALRTAAMAYPDVSFLFVDGYPVRQRPTAYDAQGNPLPNDSPILQNVAAVSFREEQSGFLAGYGAVMEGYTKLGFTGGGGGTNPACQRFGYGFVQGADAAAREKNVQVAVNYSWLHGANFAASNELQTMATGWYRNGTEVIFCCGGFMFDSVASAAGAEDGKIIGVDVDQSGQSPTVITSAVKGLDNCVQWALTEFYAGRFPELSGKVTHLGVQEKAVGLPVDTWSLRNWTVADYEALLAKIIDGTITVDNAATAFPESTANVTVTPVK